MERRTDVTTNKPDQQNAGRGRTDGTRPPEKGRDNLTGPGRTIEAPGTPGLEKEPNRNKAVGPGGQKLTSSAPTPGNEVDTGDVDKPDGIHRIDPMGETTAEETKLL